MKLCLLLLSINDPMSLIKVNCLSVVSAIPNHVLPDLNQLCLCLALVFELKVNVLRWQQNIRVLPIFDRLLEPKLLDVLIRGWVDHGVLISY